MAKKRLTIREKQKKYRTIQYVCVGGQVTSIITPFAILTGINWNKWIVENEDGTKVGIGLAMALAVGGIALALFTKKKEKESITDGWIAFVVGWFAVAFIFMLLNSIMHEISTMMLYGGIGLCSACGLEFVSQNFKTKADTIKELMNETEGETLKDKYRKELEEEEKDDGTSI